MSEVQRGEIVGSYQTRAGETVWIVAWADRPKSSMLDNVDAEAGLAIGMRVRLIGNRLERAA